MVQNINDPKGGMKSEAISSVSDRLSVIRPEYVGSSRKKDAQIKGRDVSDIREMMAEEGQGEKDGVASDPLDRGTITSRSRR